MIRPILIALCLTSTVVLAEDASVTSFKELAKEFPKESIFASNGDTAALTVSAVDVRKTTSLMNPVVGHLDVSLKTTGSGSEISMDLRLAFAWKDGKWDFEKLINQRNRKEITDLPLGKDLLAKGPLHDFLSRHGL